MIEPRPQTSPHYPARMGLEPLPLEAWLAPKPGDEVLLRERARLLAVHAPQVLARLPEGESAIAELATTLRRRGFSIAQTDDTLSALGHAIAEDLCILTQRGGSYIMSAGVLCFPNRWRLTDKIGHTMLAVHGPVPDYAGQLAQQVDRFLLKLRPDRGFIRSNWGLSSSRELFLPEPTPAVNARHEHGMYFRREDQSFMKLPETEAVIFSIRTTVTPWDETPEPLRSDILATIDGLSPEWMAYKSLRSDPKTGAK
jgi:hypothetical protein